MAATGRLVAVLAALSGVAHGCTYDRARLLAMPEAGQGPDLRSTVADVAPAPGAGGGALGPGDASPTPLYRDAAPSGDARVASAVEARALTPEAEGDVVQALPGPDGLGAGGASGAGGAVVAVLLDARPNQRPGGDSGGAGGSVDASRIASSGGVSGTGGVVGRADAAGLGGTLAAGGAAGGSLGKGGAPGSGGGVAGAGGVAAMGGSPSGTGGDKSSCHGPKPDNYQSPCGHCGGTVSCDGTCSVPDPAGYGTACGSCGGTVTCSGACSVPTPANFGATCVAATCICALQLTGTIDCSGACAAKSACNCCGLLPCN